jgi:hypothetical protein
MEKHNFSIFGPSATTYWASQRLLLALPVPRGLERLVLMRYWLLNLRHIQLLG